MQGAYVSGLCELDLSFLSFPQGLSLTLFRKHPIYGHKCFSFFSRCGVFSNGIDLHVVPYTEREKLILLLVRGGAQSLENGLFSFAFYF